MSNTTALLCRGDERRPGCGVQIGMFDRGTLVKAGSGEIEAVDRLGRARVWCRACGAVTMTIGQGERVG